MISSAFAQSAAGGAGGFSLQGLLPFILIFGLLLCFVKLKKDNELIAILSLGFGLKPFKIILSAFCMIIILVFSLFNFYLAPKVYEIYKFKWYI